MPTHDLLTRAGTVIGWLVSAGLLVALIKVFHVFSRDWGSRGQDVKYSARGIEKLSDKFDLFAEKNERQHDEIRNRLEFKIDEVSDALTRKNENEHTRLAEWSKWRLNISEQVGSIERRLDAHGIPEERRHQPEIAMAGGQRKDDPQ